MKKDIIKAVAYDRCSQTLNGETKYFTLVAMVIATDKPLVTKENPELVLMGACNISDELLSLSKYELPYKMGAIDSAILDVSCMSPDDLEIVN